MTPLPWLQPLARLIPTTPLAAFHRALLVPIQIPASWPSLTGWLPSLTGLTDQVPMIIPMQIDTSVLALFLSGGGAALVWSLVQAYRTLRSGANADDADEYTRLEADANNQRRRREFTEVERDYWHRRAAALEYGLIQAQGPDAVAHILAVVGDPPVEPEPPPLLKKRRKRRQDPDDDEDPDGTSRREVTAARRRSFDQMMSGLGSPPAIPGSAALPKAAAPTPEPHSTPHRDQEDA